MLWDAKWLRQTEISSHLRAMGSISAIEYYSSIKRMKTEQTHRF